MRTTLDLPDDVFRQLKAEAALRGLKLKQLLADLVRAGLNCPPDVGAVRTRSPLPVIRKASGHVHPALSSRQIEAILTEEDYRGHP